jgi:hypothetical protein
MMPDHFTHCRTRLRVSDRGGLTDDWREMRVREWKRGVGVARACPKSTPGGFTHVRMRVETGAQGEARKYGQVRDGEEWHHWAVVLAASEMGGLTWPSPVRHPVCWRGCSAVSGCIQKDQA